MAGSKKTQVAVSVRRLPDKGIHDGRFTEIDERSGFCIHPLPKPTAVCPDEDGNGHEQPGTHAGEQGDQKRA